jgi:hypothetical protein
LLRVLSIELANSGVTPKNSERKLRLLHSDKFRSSRAVQLCVIKNK